MQASFAIFCGNETWSVIRTQAGARQIVASEPSASAVAAELQKLDYRDQGVLVALPSSMCLSASVDADGLRSRNREAGLRFRLEEQLPLALEEIVADFIPGGTRSLGVAAQIETIKPLIDSLEGEGIQIVSICPASLLIAEQARRTSPPQDKPDLLICTLDGFVDLIKFVDDSIAHWVSLPPQFAAIEPYLRYFHLNRTAPVRLRAIGLLPELRSQIASLPMITGLTEDEPENNPLQVLAEMAEQILSTNSPAPVELRRGQLAAQNFLRQVRTPFRFAIAAAIVLAASLAISMSWRVHQYNSLADSAYDHQLQSFRDALPAQIPPPGVVSRMVSEVRRLQGLSGTGSALPRSTSILPLLRNTLAALPRDSRFRLLELRFEPDHLYLEGQTLDHTDADQIAAALRRGTVLQVDPPHTEQPAGEDVTFTISAAALSSPTDAMTASDRTGEPR